MVGVPSSRSRSTCIHSTSGTSSSSLNDLELLYEYLHNRLYDVDVTPDDKKIVDVGGNDLNHVVMIVDVYASAGLE